MIHLKNSKIITMVFLGLMGINFNAKGSYSFADEPSVSQAYQRVSKRSAVSLPSDEIKPSTVGIVDPLKDFQKAFGKALGEYALHCVMIKKDVIYKPWLTSM
ncbi:MAG: hypothetical protein BGO77_05555 [Caedibacter sp. 37-49]|nr:MAG: hypothetical protein BGO77_05555 [Caedibacter sp. 37-49]